MMTGNRLNKRRTTFPPYDEASGLSQRDQALERIERLLSEQLIVPFPEESPEIHEEAQSELVNLDEVVEEIKIQAVPLKEAEPSLPVRRLAGEDEEEKTARPEAKSSLFHSLFQAFILFFVLGWVFILGVLVGRGHVWEAGYAHEAVAWIEQKVGWTERTGPELIVKTSAPPEEAQPADNSWLPPTAVTAAPVPPAPAEAAAEENPSAPVAAADEAALPAEFQEAADDGDDEIPAWNWGAWEAPADEEAPDSLASPAAGPAADSITVGSLPAEELAQAAEEYPPAEEADEDEAVTAGPADEDDGPEPVALASAESGSQSGAAAPPLAAGDGKFAVQIALAFDEAEAERRVARLEKQGFTAYFYKNPNNRYPVRVGHFATRQDADAAKVRLEMLGYKGPYVSSLNN